jgi:hypothetical protein
VEEILKSMIFEEKTAHCIYRGSASICIASTQDGDEIHAVYSFGTE